jgi:hypothetical protein
MEVVGEGWQEGWGPLDPISRVVTRLSRKHSFEIASVQIEVTLLVNKLTMLPPLESKIGSET